MTPGIPRSFRAAFVLCLFTASSLEAEQHHVTVSGTIDGNGSMRRPWSLAAALSHRPNVSPGDTIWIHEGIYRGGQTARLFGTHKAPIRVAAWPGDTVVVDMYDGVDGNLSTFTVQGAYTDYMGFEVTCSDPSSRTSQQAGSWPDDIQRGAIECHGREIRFINLIVHDLTKGFGSWATRDGGEFNGCIIYNNGWIGPDRHHGHGVYLQNRASVKRVVNCIIFNQYSAGIHAFGSAKAAVRGLTIRDCCFFNNHSWNILVGGSMVAENIVLKGNSIYDSKFERMSIELGLSADNKDIAVTDNYVAGSMRMIRSWEHMAVTRNTFVSRGDHLVNLQAIPDVENFVRYVWDHNKYYSSQKQPFAFLKRSRSWQDWRHLTGFDANSSLQPDGVEDVSFVRKSDYETGRGHLIVYNWRRQGEVKVDISRVVPTNWRYQIHHVYDLFGAPVLAGIQRGSQVRLPMRPVPAPMPIGGDANDITNELSPEFGAFLITSRPPE